MPDLWMIAFVAGQWAIPLGFGLWWGTFVGIPWFIDTLHTKWIRFKFTLTRR